MKRPLRFYAATVMSAVYLLIILAPFANFAGRSGDFPRTLTGECSGDCRLCGCAPEMSLSGSCCCARKKAAAARKSPAVESGGSCCLKKPPAAGSADGYAASLSEFLRGNGTAFDADNRTCAITSLPCGNSKHLTLAGGEGSDLLPETFQNRIPSPLPLATAVPLKERLTSLMNEPPDPPPKILIIASISS